MQGHWLVDDPLLAPFHEGVNQFCASHLPSPEATADIDDTSYKVFADPIEGYVNLAAWQVAIVDSALFQRLRGVKQLGLAYLVYPTLGYCRFQHTLGVLARLKQVLDQLKENQALRASRKMPLDVLDERRRAAVHLAALAHDLGHCVFSHVSETVIHDLPGSETYPSTTVICEKYSDFAGRPVPIAEIMSVALVTSRRFVKFIQEIGVPTASRLNKAAELAQDAGRLILGLPLKGDQGSLYLAQLMSSGLDVDKLDYMLREAHLSGISLGISLEWLLKKLFVTELPPHELPADLGRRVRDFPAESLFAVLSLEKGGQFAFEEFCIARLALHEKIYLHQKIRAAEAFVKDRLRRLAQRVPTYLQAHAWLYLRESHLDYPELELPQIPTPDLFNEGQPRTARGLDFEWMSVRRLLHRAYAFGWFNAIAEPLTERVTASHSGTDRLMSFLKENPSMFVAKIRENLTAIRACIGSEEFPNGEPEILVDLPRIASLQQGHETLHIEHPSRLALRWTMPIDQLVDYYHKHRALAYVFTDRAWVPWVMLAAEKVAWDEFKVLYVQEAGVNSRMVSKAREVKECLHQKGFYRTARPLQPVSDFLNRVYPQTLVTRIAARLAHYESRTKRWVSPASVTTYVAQFPVDLQNAVLDWLQYLDVADPGAGVRRALRTALDGPVLRDAKRVGLCPLGAASDSATRIAYELRDVATEYPDRNLMILNLADALARNLDAYVLYDDNTNTGLQALNIVAGWMNVTLEAGLQLNEDHVQPLDETLQERFRTTPFGLVFAVGTEGSDRALLRLLNEKVGLSPDRMVCFVDKVLAREERVFSGGRSQFQHREKLRLKTFVTEVAQQIFISEGRSPEQARKRALGDNEAEGMIVFPYNCPTMTIPALWLSGSYHDGEWLPLVERARRKNPDTGAPVGEDA